MAEVVAPGSQDPPSTSTRLFPHGKKRAADPELDGEQRLSKRFDRLDLSNHQQQQQQQQHASRLSLPVPGSGPAVSGVKRGASPLSNGTSSHRRKSKPSADLMQVEDTPHTVYIHDLDAELSDMESDEDNPIFLADIEKHLAKIPKHILAGPELRATKDNAMVLYQVPSSLTIPEDQDNVRKAIVEARARIRERQASGVGEPVLAPQVSQRVRMGDMGVSRSPPGPLEDPDAMELD